MRVIFAVACLVLAALSLAQSSAAVASSTLALQATAPPLPTSPPMPTTPPAPTTPMPGASPVPSISPIPTMTPLPVPTPMATPTVLMLGPDAAPQILWVQLSSNTPHAGDALTVTVLTSSNVASVELRVGGYGESMPKTDVGHFVVTSTVPRLPFFMSHNLTLEIIARNTAGVAAEQNVPLQVR